MTRVFLWNFEAFRVLESEYKGSFWNFDALIVALWGSNRVGEAFCEGFAGIYLGLLGSYVGFRVQGRVQAFRFKFQGLGLKGLRKLCRTLQLYQLILNPI